MTDIERYHKFLIACEEYFSITSDMIRSYFKNECPFPGGFEIAKLCLYDALDPDSLRSISHRVSTVDRIKRRSSELAITWRLPFTHSDYVSAADFLCKIGLHEMQMLCMRFACELAPAPVELWL